MPLMRVFYQIFSLFLVMGAGWAFARRGFLDKGATKGLSNLILKLTLPCLIVVSLQQPFSRELLSVSLRTLAVATGFYGLIIALSLLAVRLMRTPLRQRGALAFSLSFSNCAFIGFPVVSSILGEGALFVTSIHNVLFNVLAFSAGVMMMEGGGTREGLPAAGVEGAAGRATSVREGLSTATGAACVREAVPAAAGGAREREGLSNATARGSAGEAVTVQGTIPATGDLAGNRLRIPLSRILNVNVLATLAGFLLFLLSIKIPTLLLAPMKSLGSLTTPLAMIVTGAMLARTPIKAAFGDWRVFGASALRLALWPALTWLALRFAGISGELQAITIIVAGMPAASNTGIIAEVYGGDTETASSVVFLSTLFSVISIPILAFFVA